MGGRSRTIAPACGLIVAAALLTGATSASAEDAISFYMLPEATHAKSIVAMPEGGIRFTGVDAISHGTGDRQAVVGQVTADGQVSDYPAPSKRPAEKISGRWLGETVAGSDGSLWFTDFFFYDGWRYGGTRIGHLSPTGEFTEHLAGRHLNGVRSMATDPGGNLWFTAMYQFYRKRYQAIGRITTSGELTRFRLPPRSRPQGITAGPDGNMWFAESNPKRPAIGLVTPSGHIKRFPLPAKRYPLSIVAGADGNLWFTEELSTHRPGPRNLIGRISTSGILTEFPLPGKGYVEKIAAGTTGPIWFTIKQADTQVALGSITPTGVVTKPACLEATCKLAPEAIAVGADGTLWFAAGRRVSSEGGGGTIIAENNRIEAEAGFVGRILPSP